jgi:hypothetical protein
VREDFVYWFLGTAIATLLILGTIELKKLGQDVETIITILDQSPCETRAN